MLRFRLLSLTAVVWSIGMDADAGADESHAPRLAAVPRGVAVPEAGSGLNRKPVRRSAPGIFIPEAGSGLRERRGTPRRRPSRSRPATPPEQPAVPRPQPVAPGPRPSDLDPGPQAPASTAPFGLPEIEAGSATVPRPAGGRTVPEAGSVPADGENRPEEESATLPPGRAVIREATEPGPPMQPLPNGPSEDGRLVDDPSRQRFRDLWQMAAPLLIFVGGLATAFCLVQIAGRHDSDDSLSARRIEIACDLVGQLDAVLIAGFEQDWDRLRNATIELTALNGRRLLLLDDQVNQGVSEFLEEAVHVSVIRSRAADLAKLRAKYAAVLAALRATLREAGSHAETLNRLLADTHEMTRRICLPPS